MHDDPHHDNELDDMTARARALETILVEKGLVDPAAVDAIIETYQQKVGPRNGAAVVARAWTDPEFAERLREDPELDRDLPVPFIRAENRRYVLTHD